MGPGQDPCVGLPAQGGRAGQNGILPRLSSSARPATVTVFAEQATLTVNRWSEQIPVERLQARLRFYRELRDRRSEPGKQGPYHDIYAPMVKAIEAAMRGV